MKNEENLMKIIQKMEGKEMGENIEEEKDFNACNKLRTLNDIHTQIIY